MTDDVYKRMIELISEPLASSGVSQNKAAEISTQIVNAVSENLGGKTLYLPRRTPWFDRAQRDAEIRKTYNGRNIEAVCTRFRVSRSTVYRICRK